MNNKQIGLFSLPVFVAALGYFVDVYDLLLFTIVRQPSVLAVGSTLETIIVDSAHIINWQMSGLLIGGILWGVIGDKLGRLKVLFGSILLYSVANIVTGYVQTVDQYAYCRFIGGNRAYYQIMQEEESGINCESTDFSSISSKFK